MPCIRVSPIYPAMKVRPMDSEEFPSRYRGLRPWKPGQSGNPAGRPKGSRNKLGEAFLTELHADFCEHGKEAIARVRDEAPALYVTAVASLFGKRDVRKVQ